MGILVVAHQFHPQLEGLTSSGSTMSQSTSQSTTSAKTSAQAESTLHKINSITMLWPYTCQTTLWVTGLVRVQGVTPFPATMKIPWTKLGLKLGPFTSSNLITVYCLLFSLFTSYYPTSK
jgi:hypothetical protein